MAELPTMLNGTSAPAGWTCFACGLLIPWGVMHSCQCAAFPYAVSTPEYTVPSTGWACPKCGRVWGPHVAGCERCNHIADASEKVGNIVATKSLLDPVMDARNSEELDGTQQRKGGTP